MNVLLRGSGVAIAISAHLLRQSGTPFTIEPGRRRPVPVIMLSLSALALLRDVFGMPGLFAEKARIQRRIVRWGDKEPVAMPHGAIVVSENDLAEALGPFDLGRRVSPDLTIHASSPFPVEDMRRFGSRCATAARVQLSTRAELESCWVEATADGWLFLIPDGNGSGWLLAIGGDPEALVAQSRLVSELIETVEPASGSFDTAPRMRTALAGGDWLACGMSALAFDPICGDGTAQAAREAILACAVISGIERDEARDWLLTHYHSMLLASMRRHLQLLLPFYAEGGSTSWWREQLAATRAGYEWCTEQLGVLPEPRFALRGFDLVAREGVAA